MVIDAACSTLNEDDCASHFLVFLQRYDVISNAVALIDKIDEALNCRRIRWNSISRSVGSIFLSCSFAFVPIESISSKLMHHCQEWARDLLGKYLVQKILYEQLCVSKKVWTPSVLHKNKFRCERNACLCNKMEKQK